MKDELQLNPCSRSALGYDLAYQVNDDRVSRFTLPR